MLLLELMLKLYNASITWYFLENQTWAFHSLGNYVAEKLCFGSVMRIIKDQKTVTESTSSTSR